MSVVFNGPEHIAIEYLPKTISGQRSLTLKQIRAADDQVDNKERLPIVLASAPAGN